MRLTSTIAKLALREYVAYRLNFLLEILGTLVFLGVSLIIWLFLFRQQAGAAIGTYTQPELVTYLLAAALIATFLIYAGQGDEIDRDITEGRLSLRLTQPFSVLGYWFIRDAVRKGALLTVGFVGFAIVYALN